MTMEGVSLTHVTCIYPSGLMLQKRTYVNDRITDNNWNTMWYYQAPVSASSQRFIGRVPRDGTVRIWDTLLEQYLAEFRNKDESERDEDM